MAAPPAFPLEFDPMFIFQSENSGEHDFDKILNDLDLELATDHTSSIVQQTVVVPNALPPAAPGGGLRELFGVQQGWGLQQPQQPQQQVQQQMSQQPLQQLQQQPAAFGMQELLRQQQLAYQQQLMLQQQQAQGLGVVYQLPSPFMQPLSALAPALPTLQGASMYSSLQTSLPGLNGYVEQQPHGMTEVSTNGLQQQQQVQAPGPMFTFSSLPPMPAHLQQPAASVPLGAAATAGGLWVLPPGSWPYAQQQSAGVGLTASPSNGDPAVSPAGQTVPSGGGDGSVLTAAAAAPAPAPARRGRGRAAAPAAPGAEKPKGPSQRFRERQKQTISSLEQEVTQKLAELQMLSEENEMLKLRSAVLEAVTSGREYHMKVIKEHGPPTFEVADSSPHHRSNSSPMSALGSCKAYPAGSDCNSQGGSAAANDSPRSGSLTSSHTGGNAAAAAAADAVAAMAADATSLPAAGAAGGGGEEAGCPADPLQCAGVGACSADVQKRSIRCIRQMTSDDIIMHWRQFLHDVSEELLTADEQEDQQRLEAGLMGRADRCCDGGGGLRLGRQHEQQQQDSDDSAFTMSKVCRWCGCTNTEGLQCMAEGCSGAASVTQQQQGLGQELQDTSAAATAAAAAAAGVAAAVNATATASAPAAAGGGVSNVTDERLVALVNKYSYMTKFVALLNPGVLYSLLGRNLDTGESAAYTDAHWRQVVARLHLTKQQVTYILACAELYFSSLSSLMAERQALHEALCRADGAMSECQQRLLGVDGTLDQLQLLDRLSSNLKREHVLRIMLNCFVWGRILTAVQFAKTAVYSHPFFPDVHAMVCVLYEDQWEDGSPGFSEGKVFPHRIAAAKALAAQTHPAAATAASGAAFSATQHL